MQVAFFMRRAELGLCLGSDVRDLPSRGLPHGSRLWPTIGCSETLEPHSPWANVTLDPSQPADTSKSHGRVIVTVLLPVSLPVVSLTKNLNESTSPGLSSPVVVLRLSVSDGTVATTVVVSAS